MGYPSTKSGSAPVSYPRWNANHDIKRTFLPNGGKYGYVAKYSSKLKASNLPPQGETPGPDAGANLMSPRNF